MGPIVYDFNKWVILTSMIQLKLRTRRSGNKLYTSGPRNMRDIWTQGLP